MLRGIDAGKIKSRTEKELEAKYGGSVQPDPTAAAQPPPTAAEGPPPTPPPATEELPSEGDEKQWMARFESFYAEHCPDKASVVNDAMMAKWRGKVPRDRLGPLFHYMLCFVRISRQSAASWGQLGCCLLVRTAALAYLRLTPPPRWGPLSATSVRPALGALGAKVRRGRHGGGASQGGVGRAFR